MSLKPRDSQPRDVVPIRRAFPRHSASRQASLHNEESAIVALVDELAILTADLWFAGRLKSFSTQEELDNDHEM